jgi:hypothetical protein
MILITSAAYVNSEFQIEFGKLPPALLPVQNRRLFEHQIDLLEGLFPAEKIFISLPEGYALSAKDEIFLERRGVKVVRNDEGITLGQSIDAAIAKSEPIEGSLRILHGDTLIGAVPQDLDCIGLVETNEDYAWEVERIDVSSESIWCGYFSFSSVVAFRAALKRAEYKFIEAVREYDSVRKLARVNVEGWCDFGHVNTYFQSRAKLTTERAFNELVIRDACVRKTGVPHEKIVAEYSWFRALPVALRPFVPQLIDHGTEAGCPYYVLEYMPLPPLNEVYVHGRNPVFYWDKIFALCSNFLNLCCEQAMNEEQLEKFATDAREMAGSKTWTRLERYVAESGHPGLDVPQRINGTDLPSLRSIVSDCIARLGRTPAIPGVLHGDFCLSNILFDSRIDRIKVIDPRGLNARGQISTVGDLRYDLAKLTHSIIGLYDYIIAGAFDITANLRADRCDFQLDIHADERIEKVQEAFRKRRFLPAVDVVDIMPMTIMLFLSMLPLHADKPQRQTALLANALRLYAEYFLPRKAKP